MRLVNAALYKRHVPAGILYLAVRDIPHDVPVAVCPRPTGVVDRMDTLQKEAILSKVLLPWEQIISSL